jgi:hypothetical protein
MPSQGHQRQDEAESAIRRREMPRRAGGATAGPAFAISQGASGGDTLRAACWINGGE